MVRINPEVTYYLNESLTIEDVKEAYKYNKTLTGKVICIDAAAKLVKVSLSRGLTAKMSWNDVTIKKLTFKFAGNTKVPPQVSSLFGKKVRVKVKAVSDNNIFVSRKANMLEAWNEVKKLPDNYVFNASYTGTSQYGAYLFYDIGEGLVAFCHIHDCTAVFVPNIAEWIKYGEIHKVSITVLNEEDDYSINCSRKKACPKDIEDFCKYDIVNVKISKMTSDSTGYHVEVTPRLSGIADFPYKERQIKYGEVVKASIRKIVINSEKKKVNLAIL